MRPRRLGTYAMAAMLAMIALAPSTHARVTQEEAARLVGIALVTDWVAQNCPTEKLNGMILTTARSTLRQLEPEKLALGRKRVAARAAAFPSKAAACERWTADLVAIQ